jgi:outer membrane protein
LRALLLSTGAALLAVASPALAQDAAAPGDIPAPAQGPVTPDADVDGNSFLIGVGAAIVPTYEGSDSSRVVPVPQVRASIDGYTVSTRGTKLLLDIVPNDPGPTWDYQFGPVVSLNFSRNGNPEDRQVDLLGRKKLALELGGFAGVGKTGVITSDYDKLSASVVFVQDVSGVNKSFTLTPQIDYSTPLSRKAFVGISGSITYVGDGYADTYFGVTPAGALRSGLPGFNPDADWKNWSVSAYAAYSLTGDLLGGLQLVGGVSYSRLLNDFARSPVVSIAGDRNQWFYALGLGYSF